MEGKNFVEPVAQIGFPVERGMNVITLPEFWAHRF